MTSEKKNNELNATVPIGNLDNFEALFKQYYAPLVVYACKYVPEMDAAREIVQDFFVKLYEKRSTLTIDTSLKVVFVSFGL